MTRITEADAAALLRGLLGAAAPRKGARRKDGAGGGEKSVAATHIGPLIVTVPGHGPTVNHMYVTARGGARILSEAARAWYDRAIPAIREAAAGYAVPDGPLRLTIVLYALPRSRDLDNALKSSQDALAKALEFDDKRIDYLAVARGVGKPARTVYTLEAL